MIVRLFDIQNNKVIPSEHCYALPFLKKIKATFYVAFIFYLPVLTGY